MSDATGDLDTAIRAVCDGRPVDWAAVHQSSTADARRLEALKALEEIARLHRSPSLIDTAATVVSSTSAHASWGHLQLLEHMASGAFGDVYRAWDPALDREVALKLLRRSPDADAAPEEAVDEGRLLARVHHPNVVTVHGAARLDGKVGLWMELVHGHTLADVVAAEGPLSASRVAAIGEDLCAALTAVHVAGLLHRDVKPHNVMLADDGRVVLMDFGAGREVRHAAFDVIGTPTYLAPEVLAGTPATAQSDIYSVGVLIAFALTGSNDIRVSRTLSADVSPTLSAVVERATAEAPRDRFESTAALGAALRATTAAQDRTSWVRYTTAVGGLLIALAALMIVALHDLWPLGERAVSRAPGKIYPTMHPLWTRRPGDLDIFGRPTPDGRVLPMTPDYVRVVLTDLDLSNPRQGPALGEASGDLGGCDPSVRPITLSSSATDAAFACEVAPNRYELRTERLDTRHPSQRRLFSGPLVTPLQWSPSGVLLVQRSESAGALLGVIDTRTGESRWIPAVHGSVGQAALSPDGKWIAFDAAIEGDPLRRGVFLVALSGGPSALIAAGPTGSILPTWLRDGRAILFVSDRTGSPGLWMQPVSGGRATGDASVVAQDLGRVASIWAVTPEGAFIYFRQTGLMRIGTARLGTDGFVEGAPADLPTHQMGATMMPGWAPDGRRLVYQTRMTGAQDVELTVMDVAHGVESTIRTTIGGLRHPRWSPDGRSIVVKGEDGLGRSGIFVIDAENGRATPLRVVAANEEDPLGGVVWDPNGTLVAEGGDGFVRIDPQTGRITPLAKARPAPVGFSVSRDGAIAMIEQVENTPVLKIVRPGMEPRDVLRSDKSEHFSDPVWMPDGRTLLFVRWKDAPGKPAMREAWRVDTQSGAARSIKLVMERLRELTVSSDGRQLAFTFGANSREPWVIEHFLPAARAAGAN